MTNNFTNSTRGPSVVSPESSLFVPWYIFLVMFASSTAFALNALIEENRIRSTLHATEQSNAQLLNPYLQHHVEKEALDQQDQVPSTSEPSERAAPSGGPLGHHKHHKRHKKPQQKKGAERRHAKDSQGDKTVQRQRQRQQIDRRLEKIIPPPSS